MEFVEQIVDFLKASPSFKFDYTSNGTGAFIKVDALSKLFHVLRGGDNAARMFFYEWQTLNEQNRSQTYQRKKQLSEIRAFTASLTPPRLQVIIML